ncbi:unnamed protein product [Symbiodinium natans]|uniref:Uncharacterized protein n=1 Tax=Symbiodinium natans TaxID=878477 RepID=A0A812P2E6_9DINO|nr:unnamed protein product [Symbiodinium natans]
MAKVWKAYCEHLAGAMCCLYARYRALWVKQGMGKIKVFPTPDYRSKQPSDPVVPKLPATGILLGPSKSGKTVALISMILEQTGDAALDTLFIRGRHFQISTWVSTQKLRLISNAVRVNAQFFMVWRLRNQLEKDSLLEELTALVPKQQLHAMYEEAVRVGAPPAEANEQTDAGYGNVNCCTSAAAARVYDPSRKRHMTTIYVDFRKRVAGTDADFEFDVGETVHLQNSARLGVFKIRVADTFLSTDRHLSLLEGRRPQHLEVGAAARGSLHRGPPCCVDQQQLRHGRPRGIHQRDRGGLRWQQDHPQRLRAADPLPQFRKLPRGRHDIIAKIICSQGVGYIMQSSTDDNHLVNIQDPITLRYLRFKLTDLNGNVVNLRGTSISFCVYLATKSDEQAPAADETKPKRGRGRQDNMMTIEPRNEATMLRQFWKKYPSYNLNSLMRKRYEELMDAKAFNEWLSNRQLKQEGEAYADAMGRLTEAVNHRVLQLRRPDFGEVLAFINEGEPLNFPLPNRKAAIYTSSHFYLTSSLSPPS